MPALAVLGNLTRDLAGDDRRPRPGGGPFHAARALRELGRDAVVLAKCAVADRPMLLPPLLALGVRTVWRGGESTATFRLRYSGDRRELDVLALDDSWGEHEVTGWIAEAVVGARWLHVAPLARSDFPPETLERLARGRRLSLDGQGLVRPARKGPLELDAHYDPAVLAGVAFLKLADDEAEVLLGEVSEESLRSLGVPEVAVTHGSRGATLLADGRVEHVATRPVDGDPTGAGDAFCASYVAERAAGRPPLAAARRAASLVAAVIARR